MEGSCANVHPLRRVSHHECLGDEVARGVPEASEQAEFSRPLGVVVSISSVRKRNPKPSRAKPFSNGHSATSSASPVSACT